MSGRDRELESWWADWASSESARQEIAGSADAGEIRRIIARGKRRFVFQVVSSVVVGLLYVGLALALAIARPRPTILALSGGIVALVAVAFGFDLWNRLGAWRPIGESVRDFAALGAERCRRELRAIMFGWWFMAVEILLLLGWIAWARSENPLPELTGLRGGWMLPPLVVAAISAWLVWLGRRARTELAALEQILAALDD